MIQFAKAHAPDVVILEPQRLVDEIPDEDYCTKYTICLSKETYCNDGENPYPETVRIITLICTVKTSIPNQQEAKEAGANLFYVSPH